MIQKMDFQIAQKDYHTFVQYFKFNFHFTLSSSFRYTGQTCQDQC